MVRALSEHAGFGILVAYDLMIPMRDGTHLATDVYWPAREGERAGGAFPTILCRTPYDKTDRRYTEIADVFTPRGYVVVLQDLRDRFRSEGAGGYFHTVRPHEGEDGYDTIEWIAGEPWSDGKVGMVGSSWAAIAQVRAALERPPHLAAIWPDVVPTSNYRNQAREGGAMQLHMFWALLSQADESQELADDPAKRAEVWADLRRMRELLLATPWREGQLALRYVPALEQTLLDYYRRGTYDEWWAQIACDFTAHWDRHADVPAVLSSGWFDPFCGADMDYYSVMAARNRSPQRLVIGPWDHGGMRGDATWAGDVDFGPEAPWGVGRYFAEQVRFFDRHLRGIDERPDEAPVQLFVMGGGSGRRTELRKLDHGGHWRSEREWPLARTAPTAYYLHPGFRLAAEPPPAAAEPLSYTYDPATPVPSIGGALCMIGEESPALADASFAMWTRFLPSMLRLRHVVPPGPAHQQETEATFGAVEPGRLLADRADVLAFRSDPLVEPLELTGAATVRLWVASSAKDTDFTAKLIDEYPPNDDYPEGYHMLLVDSIIRARYRDGWDREVFLTPGEVVEVTIELPPTSNVFMPGHRVRLDISSSNFPRLDLNPNTGEPIGRHTHTVPARQQVYVDAARPSHAMLPVVPAQNGATGSSTWDG